MPGSHWDLVQTPVSRSSKMASKYHPVTAVQETIDRLLKVETPAEDDIKKLRKQIQELLAWKNQTRVFEYQKERSDRAPVKREQGNWLMKVAVLIRDIKLRRHKLTQRDMDKLFHSHPIFANNAENKAPLPENAVEWVKALKFEYGLQELDDSQVRRSVCTDYHTVNLFMNVYTPMNVWIS